MLKPDGYMTGTIIGARTSAALIAELRASRKVVEAAREFDEATQRIPMNDLGYGQWLEAHRRLEAALAELSSINVRNANSREEVK